MRAVKFAGLLSIVVVTGLTLSIGEPPSAHAADSYGAIKERAEQYYTEGSYQRAYELYTQATKLELPPVERRWVELRIADTQWRGEGGTSTTDDARRVKASQSLATLISARDRVVDHDRVWAEAHESLGDYCWQTNRLRDWHQAWQHYASALEWWASSPDIELARARYLRIVRKVAEPADGGYWQNSWDYHFGYHCRSIPLDVLSNAEKISTKPEDIALSKYLLAMHLRQQGDWRQQRRIAPAFDAALEHAAGTEWYDDALYFYAQWLSQRGRPVLQPNGSYTFERDYVKAVELYRRLLDEFEKGDTRFYDRATDELKEIVSPRVGVYVATIFVPGSEIQFQASWRNVETVTFSIFAVSLVEDIDFKSKNVVMPGEHPIDLAGREPLLTWKHPTGDKGDHVPGQDQITVDQKLLPGAYVLEARAGGERAHTLMMVTDIVAVLKTSATQALVYVCNADDGSPRPGANVTLWKHHRQDDRPPVCKKSRSNDDGLAMFEIENDWDWREIYAAAQDDDRQAFARTDRHYGNTKGEWRIYVFTDRPAYRPGDWARWKLIARRYQNGTYSTPADREFTYKISDACGNEIEKSTVKFNAFGSGWGTLELTDKMPLGEFHVEFFEGADSVGRATMFRLEEYKLPEFKVTIETPKDEQGQPRAFRLGESVEVEISAEYYFGGPVADADVRVIVYQSPYYHYWTPPHEFGWYYEDMGGRPYYWGYGQQTVKDEHIQTDSSGKATIRFDTPHGANQDYQYRIEARVTDASRREIVGNSSIRVTRQSYYVHMRPEHNLYRPQDTVKIEVKALDANEQPQSVTGTITLTRERWTEIWLDSDGKEVSGDELRERRLGCIIWPPIPEPGRADWRLKFRGYEREELLTQTVTTDKDGNATFKFEPEREGYYRCAWVSIVDGEGPVQAETTAWAATEDSRNLGFRPGRVDIIVDRDTFHSGQTAPVMLTVPTNDRYVLFTLSADDLYSYQVVHVTGDAKLLEVPITSQHVPNVYLDAAMVSERQIFTDTEQVVVPPVEEFLTVDVEANKEAYEPREEGTLTVRTRDHEGNAVAAEVALSLSDESVYYIQQDYAGDPRQFFYGRKRGQETRLGSMLDRLRFMRLVRDKHGEVVDEVSELRERCARDLKPVDELSIDATHGTRRGDISLGFGEFDQYRMAGRGGGAVFEAASLPMAGGSRERAFKSDLSDGEWMYSYGALNTPPPPPPSMSEPESGDFVATETVQVRSDFRATALWEPLIVTDADGYATLPVTFPDSLTSWRAVARAATTETQIGIGNATVRTRKPLIVRLQAPRFFLVGDTVTVSAVMNNNTDEALRVLPALAAEGLQIESWRRGEEWVAGEPEPITIAANGDARVDWQVRVTEPGTANLKAVARGKEYADAMQREFVVYEHGIDKLVAKSGNVRGDDVTVTLNIPAERKPESTTLTVQVTPSVAVTMLDALPYLVDYPYGCVEQTMSRFLPAVITAKTLNDLGLEREIVANKLFGGIEQDPETLKHVGQRNLEKLDDVVSASLKRLYDAQRQ
ncbi:MAG: alpha-2-macroglobulin, partial [Phycisphaerae bacterium]|nr:alpha-2-macroglobulin [Phycisphaerae bacterium]